MTVPVLTLLAALFMQAEPIDVGVNSGGAFGFNWSVNPDGSSSSETTDVEFHYMPDPPIAIAGLGIGDGHVTVRLPLVAVVGENVITMKASLAGVPGGIYNLNVRLIGVGGNPSQYSNVLGPMRVRVKNPDAPTNLRVVGE